MGRGIFGNLHRVRCPLPSTSPNSPCFFPVRSVINPSTGKVLTKITAGCAKDVDVAVAAAQKAFDTVWGHNCPSAKRGRLLNKLADIMEARFDALCAVEALDNGSSPLSNLFKSTS